MVYSSFQKHLGLPSQDWRKSLRTQSRVKTFYTYIFLMNQKKKWSTWSLNSPNIKLIANRWAWALVPTRLVEPGSALARGSRCPWQPCERPPRGTVTLKHSVEYLPTNTYQALTYKKRGRVGRNKHSTASKQQATNMFNKDSLCAFSSLEVPLLRASDRPKLSWENCWPALVRG